MSAAFVVFRDLIDEGERMALQEYALKLRREEALSANPAGKNRF